MLIETIDRSPRTIDRAIQSLIDKGKIKRVASNTYIIIPSNVDLTGDDLLDELENSGVYI